MLFILALLFDMLMIFLLVLMNIGVLNSWDTHEFLTESVILTPHPLQKWFHDHLFLRLWEILGIG